MSAKKVTAKEIFNREVRPIRVEQKKEKSVGQVKVKKKEEEEVIDDRLEIAAFSLSMLPAECFEKLEVRKALKRQESRQKAEECLQKQGETLLQVKKQHNLPKKEKPAVKNRAKIFKEQLINEIPLQTKTSIDRWSYGQGTTPSKLIIGCWNVNGIRSVINKKMLYPYIHTNKPDILCITETKADQKNFDSSPIKIDGYQGYWNFPKHSSGYSGVAVFSKYLPKYATEDMLERQHSQQGRILTLYFQRFILINIYVPTVGKDLERIEYRRRYDTAFRDHISRIRAENPDKPVIIAGDLNVAHNELDTHPGKNIMLSPSFTATERQGMTELLNLGYADVFRTLHPEKRAYTWWYVNIGGRDRLDTPGLGRRIDYFLVPKDCMRWVKRCQILRQFYGADHCPIEMQLDLQQ